MEIELLKYLYVEYLIGVILITELLKKYIPASWHPKWLTLAIAIVCAGAEVAYRIFLHSPLNVWFLVISFGVAVLGYDYLVKPIKDKLSGLFKS